MRDGRQGKSSRAFCSSRGDQERSSVCLAGAPHQDGKDKEIRLSTASRSLSCLMALLGQGCWGSVQMLVGMHMVWAWGRDPYPQEQRGWCGNGPPWLWPTCCFPACSWGQRWPQPAPARFPNDLSTLRSSGGGSCQPVLLIFPGCCSWWHCVFCKQHKPPEHTEQQKCLGTVNPQKLRNGGLCCSLSTSLNGLASVSFLLIHQQCFSVFAILGTAYTRSARLVRNALGFAPAGQPFLWMAPNVWELLTIGLLLGCSYSSTRQANSLCLWEDRTEPA